MSTRIVVTTGPESSGKTTLAGALSRQLGAPLVSEASRDYLGELYARQPGVAYRQQDLLAIARLQLQREQAALAQAPAVLVCDTDLLVIMVWSEVRFGNCDTELLDLFARSLQAAPRHYLLCDHRIPWEPDPLREHPQSRDMLYLHYMEKLELLDLGFTRVTGPAPLRLQQALAAAAATGF